MTSTSASPPEAQEALFERVYQELRRIARSQRRAVGSPATLDTTALVHEVYIKLHASQSRSIDRVHFLSLAARAMRQVLVDHARGRSRLKRGGAVTITGLTENNAGANEDMIDLVALDSALSRLSEMDPRAGQLVEWKIFGGLEIADVARMQNLTERTVFRDWRRARAFLVRELGLDSDGIA